MYEKYANDETNGPTHEELHTDESVAGPLPSPIVRAKEQTFRKLSTVFDMPAKIQRAKRRKESNIGFEKSKESVKRLKRPNSQ